MGKKEALTNPPLARIMAAMTEKTAQLEEKIAHLTRAVEDLSDIVAEQSQTLEVFTRRLRALMQREAEREAESGTQVPLADQRPPHW